MAAGRARCAGRLKVYLDGVSLEGGYEICPSKWYGPSDSDGHVPCSTFSVKEASDTSFSDNGLHGT